MLKINEVEFNENFTKLIKYTVITSTGVYLELPRYPDTYYYIDFYRSKVSQMSSLF